MRTSDRNVLIAFVVLAVMPAACSPASDHADRGTRIACARGDAALAMDCTVAIEATRAGAVLTVRRDDGGFRRLLATHDGRGVIAADGAQPASVGVVGRDVIEVHVGDDRYRLPASVGATH